METLPRQDRSPCGEESGRERNCRPRGESETEVHGAGSQGCCGPGGVRNKREPQGEAAPTGCRVERAG
eukprot:scaffold109_cov252-Pinguiococcus_pyrenoidosus.AAC.97